MKSYEQLLQYQWQFHFNCSISRLKKSISQSDMPRILLWKGHWKILFSTSRKKCFSKQDDRKKVKPWIKYVWHMSIVCVFLSLQSYGFLVFIILFCLELTVPEVLRISFFQNIWTKLTVGLVQKKGHYWGKTQRVYWGPDRVNLDERHGVETVTSAKWNGN